MDAGFVFFHSLLGASRVIDFITLVFAKYLPYVLIILTVLFLLREKSWRTRLFMTVFILTSILISRGVFTEAIRFFYHRERPFQALAFQPLFRDTAESFPSGHAAFFFALSASLFYFHKRWGGWFFLFALINGIARIIAGVHWPIDILGGFIVGLCSFLITFMLLKPFALVFSREKDLIFDKPDEKGIA